MRDERERDVEKSEKQATWSSSAKKIENSLKNFHVLSMKVENENSDEQMHLKFKASRRS